MSPMHFVLLKLHVHVYELFLLFTFIKGMLSYTNFLSIMLETMSMTTQWGLKLKTQVDGYVGFDSIQEQIRLNSLKRGFEFNVMVVGKNF